MGLTAIYLLICISRDRKSKGQLFPSYSFEALVFLELKPMLTFIRKADCDENFALNLEVTPPPACSLKQLVLQKSGPLSSLQMRTAGAGYLWGGGGPPAGPPPPP